MHDHSFDRFVYGPGVADAWTGQVDSRWYGIAGTNGTQWIASAVVNGNAPGSNPTPPAPASTPALTPGVFTAKAGGWSVSVRKAPSVSAAVVRTIAPNTSIAFDRFVYGAAVRDAWTGDLDYRWYGVAGTNGTQWVASAVVYGNAPGSSPKPPSVRRTTYWPYDSLQPGDILIMRGTITADVQLWAYGAYWTHAAIYQGVRDGKHWIIEAPLPGVKVRERALEEYGHPEAWQLMRVSAPAGVTADAVAYARRQIGMPYAWGSKLEAPLRPGGLDKWREDSFYCASLVWHAWYAASGGAVDLDSNYSSKPQTVLWIAIGRAGVDYVTPEDIWFTSIGRPGTLQFVTSNNNTR